MTRVARILLMTTVAAAIAALCAPVAADAMPIYGYRIMVSPDTSDFWSNVDRLDPSKQTLIRQVRSGVEVTRSAAGTGQNSYGITAAIHPGDVMEVYQSASAATLPNPPGVPPTESFTVPPISVVAAAGNPTVSGVAEDGSTVRVNHAPPCRGASDSTVASRSPGAFSVTFGAPIQVGERVRATLIRSDLDSFTEEMRVPGDAHCLSVWASATDSSPTEVNPYAIEAWGLDDDVAASVRIVLRRGGTPLTDQSVDSAGASTEVAFSRATQPHPGDVVEVYRPKTAPSPAYTFTIPAISGVFDAGVDLVAINAPAASVLEAGACRAFDCANASYRDQRDFAGGSAVFSFTQSLGYERVHDILPDDMVTAHWESPDGLDGVTLDLPAGDLTPPSGSLVLAKRLKLKKSARRFKVKVVSSESATADLALGVSSRDFARAAAGNAKTINLATARAALAAGANTVTLKLTSKGGKLLTRLARGHKRVNVTLTVNLADSAGNRSTVVKQTKLAGV